MILSYLFVFLSKALHSIALTRLPRRQLVANAGKWVITGLQLQANGRAFEPEGFAEGLDQITPITLRQAIRLIAMQYDDRWALTALMRISELNASPTHQRRRMRIKSFAQHIVQLTGGQIFDGGLTGFGCTVQQLANIAAMQG